MKQKPDIICPQLLLYFVAIHLAMYKEQVTLFDREVT